jgi:hypothetical protein
VSGDERAGSGITCVVSERGRPAAQRLHAQREVERGGGHLAVGASGQRVLQQPLLQHEPRQRQRRHRHARTLIHITFTLLTLLTHIFLNPFTAATSLDVKRFRVLNTTGNIKDIL